jgi:redox-regulated HSP33 family molecular chaperone
MPTPEGQITGSEIWQQQPKLVRVACHHCAKKYDIAEENVRVDNYCTECK